MKSVDNYIKKGALFSTGELYLPVRLKPDAGRTLEDGINHIELRMFDLNPLYPMGISADDLNFTHFFILAR